MSTLDQLLGGNKKEPEKKETPVDPFAALKSSLEGTPSPESENGTGEVSEPPISPPASPVASLADEFNSEDQPDSLNENVLEKFKNSMSVLENNMDNKEMVSAAIASALQMVNDNEVIKNMLQPEDVGLMVRGLRESYGTIIAKKETRGKKRQVSDANVDDIMKGLKDIDISI